MTPTVATTKTVTKTVTNNAGAGTSVRGQVVTGTATVNGIGTSELSGCVAVP